MCIISYLISRRMLDEFAREMDVTEGKMDYAMKKMAKVLHMSSGKFTLVCHSYACNFVPVLIITTLFHHLIFML